MVLDARYTLIMPDVTADVVNSRYRRTETLIRPYDCGNSSGKVLFQAAIPHMTAKGISPGHHLLAHLKSFFIRRPELWNRRQNKPLAGCQTGNGALPKALHEQLE